MRAVLVRFYGPTYAAGSRVGLQAQGFPKRIYPRLYELDYGPEIRTLAERYAREVLGWESVEVQGPYDLPGDVGVVVLVGEANS
jgi:hypothetical protein